MAMVFILSMVCGKVGCHPPINRRTGEGRVGEHLFLCHVLRPLCHHDLSEFLFRQFVYAVLLDAQFAEFFFPDPHLVFQQETDETVSRPTVKDCICLQFRLMDGRTDILRGFVQVYSPGRLDILPSKIPVDLLICSCGIGVNGLGLRCGKVLPPFVRLIQLGLMIFCKIFRVFIQLRLAGKLLDGIHLPGGLILFPWLLRLHGSGRGQGGGTHGDGGHRSAVGAFARRGQRSLPVGPGLEGLVPEKAASTHLSPGLAGHMAQFVAQQGLTTAGGEIQRPGREADPVPHGHGLGPCLPHHRALIKLDRGKVHPKGSLHLAPNGPRQVHTAPHLLLGGHGSPLELLQAGPFGALSRSGRWSCVRSPTGLVCLCHGTASSTCAPSKGRERVSCVISSARVHSPLAGTWDRPVPRPAPRRALCGISHRQRCPWWRSGTLCTAYPPAGRTQALRLSLQNGQNSLPSSGLSLIRASH